MFWNKVKFFPIILNFVALAIGITFVILANNGVFNKLGPLGKSDMVENVYLILLVHFVCLVYILFIKINFSIKILTIIASIIGILIHFIFSAGYRIY